MTNQPIRVRRSGLITFAIKLGSTLTGFAFIVLVTSNLAPQDFGLWQLISRVIGYVIFVLNIPYFWTTRYRARGTKLGRTVMLECAILSVIFTLVYVFVSLGIAGTFPGGYARNLHFLIISALQVPLYIFSGVLEAILWGSSPEEASFGFGIFEIAKVVIGALAVAVFHLGLTGAILAVTGAQVVQVLVALFLTRHEYTDKISTQLIWKMIKTGWVALLNLFGYFVSNFDFLIVAVLAGPTSTVLVAMFAAALVYTSVITYSNWIAFGLYAGILSGIDPKKSGNQVLELQYIFTAPMVVGEIVLAYLLLHIFKQNYVEAVPILIVLTIASALNAFSLTFDNIITGADKTDAAEKADMSLYLKSKLFVVAKINITLAASYLAVLSVVTYFLARQPSFSLFGYSQSVSIGILWAFTSLGMWLIAVLLKVGHVRQLTTLSIPRRSFGSIVSGSALFGAVLYVLSKIITIHGGAVLQALYVLLMGGIGLGVYAAVLLSLNPELRKLARSAIFSLLNP